jgi:branched-chain amino acid transport system substrate-binding protein
LLSLAEGVICPVAKITVADQLPADDPQAKVVKEYKKLYEEKFKKQPDTFGAHAWDALGQVVDALKAVGPDKAKVRDYLENLKNWPGQNGVFNRTPKDHVGLAWDCYAMVEVKDGKWKLVKK